MHITITSLLHTHISRSFILSYHLQLWLESGCLPTDFSYNEANNCNCLICKYQDLMCESGLASDFPSVQPWLMLSVAVWKLQCWFAPSSCWCRNAWVWFQSTEWARVFWRTLYVSAKMSCVNSTGNMKITCWRLNIQSETTNGVADYLLRM